MKNRTLSQEMFHCPLAAESASLLEGWDNPAGYVIKSRRAIQCVSLLDGKDLTAYYASLFGDPNGHWATSS